MNAHKCCPCCKGLFECNTLTHLLTVTALLRNYVIAWSAKLFNGMKMEKLASA